MLPQELLGVFLRLNLLACKYLLNDALLVNDKGGADGALSLLAVHHLLAPSTHGLHQGLIHIGNQGEGQSVLLLELLVRGSRVLADANNLEALSLKLAIVVAQAASLSRTAAGIVLGIEVQHQLTSFVITQTNVSSLFVFAQNLGRLVSNIHSRQCLMMLAKIGII